MNRRGRIDILANNAGINRRGNLLALTEDDWHASFAVNLNSMFYLCRAVIPHMIEAGGGAIVNTASQWGLYPAPNHIAYNVTKAAVASFTQNLARDYAPNKIRVNAVCPGEIHTPMLEAGVMRAGKTIADLDRLVPFRTHRQARRGSGSGCIPRLRRSTVHVRIACRNHRSSSCRVGRQVNATRVIVDFSSPSQNWPLSAFSNEGLLAHSGLNSFRIRGVGRTSSLRLQVMTVRPSTRRFEKFVCCDYCV